MGILLNSREHRFFDQIGLEVLRLAGTPDPVLWKFYKILPVSVDSSVFGQIDCLYKEPYPESQHYLTFGNAAHPHHPHLLCFFEKPDTLTDVNDGGGLVERFEGKMWFSRRNLEDLKVPLDTDQNHITPGDILQLWARNKLRTWYFETIRVERDGWEHDSDVFTHYNCDMVRNDSFDPERKISGD
jgi:hypothetical protein